MLKVVILVCSMQLAPADCQLDTATAVIQGPDASDAVLCGLHGQAYLAITGLATARNDEYLKIRCTHPSSAPAIGRASTDLP
jgi:hypothetical protein